MANYRVEVKSEIHSAEIAEWTRLWQDSPNAGVFNSYEWFKTCRTTFNTREYKVYLCYRNNELMAVFPTEQTKKFGIKTISSINPDFTAGSPILFKSYDDTKILTMLLKNILLNNNLYISKIDHELTKKIYLENPESLLSLIFISPFVRLDKGSLNSISSSFKRDLEKILRKNQNLNMKVYQNQSDLKEQLEVVFDINRRSSKQIKGRDIFAQEEVRTFYKNIVRNSNKNVFINILYSGKDPIAFGFNLTAEKYLLGLQASYVNKYRHLSPGKLNLYLMLKYLDYKDYVIWDFCAGMSDYKLKFTSDYYFHYDLYLSSNPVVRLWWRLINFARRMKQMILPEKNTLDSKFLFKTFP